MWNFQGAWLSHLWRGIWSMHELSISETMQSCRTLITRKMFWCWPRFFILLLWNIQLYIITGDRSESEKNEMHIQNLPGSHDMPKIFKCCSSRCVFCCSLRCIFCYSPRCIFWQFQGGGVPDPSKSPLVQRLIIYTWTNGYTDRRKNDLLDDPGRHFRPGYKRSFGQCLRVVTLFSYK